MNRIYRMRKSIAFLSFVFPLLSTVFLIRYNPSPFLKSAIVISNLLISVGTAVILLVLLIKYRPEHGNKLLSILCIAFSFAMIFPFAPYLVPDRTLSVKLQTVLYTEQENSDKNGWWCLYDFSSLGMHFEDGHLPENLKTEDLDLENYAYLFSPGYEVESVRYNMWDIYPQDKPIIDLGNSRRFAQITTKGEWNQDKIYVYKLKKAAIQNIYYTKFRDYEEFEYLMNHE